MDSLRIMEILYNAKNMLSARIFFNYLKMFKNDKK